MTTSAVSAPTFDAFVAVDWSGASKVYKGIAVAKCEAGRSAPTLMASERGRLWTRAAFAEWLKQELNDGKRLLIGLDFAFGLPYEANHGYLGGQASQIDNIFALWNLIDRDSRAESDFGCTTFVNHPKYASLFWRSGPRCSTWAERKRQTELACAKATRTYPETVYKLLGSKQVGRASITGIRVLHHVRAHYGKQVAIWPFEKVKHSTIVEIYPTLFRRSSMGTVAKVRSVSDLNAGLAVLGSDPVARRGHQSLSDHETDALLSAAGLRSIARLPETWIPRNSTGSLARREGWIFGVRF